ncbi:hypothetical protein [Limosilactobacillus equigenerosi]|uniref:hypothetical protein n=1 Tax=Limosilactobacillus equigenerosi TaxID=417373 RepID=UPI0006D03050|nr:hypothetical protein [Limosilactobacillus equigenerosi]
MSFGKTDSWWWNKIYERLKCKNDNCELIIYWYKNDDNVDDDNVIDNVIKKFLNIVWDNFNESEKDRFSKNEEDKKKNF